MQYIHIKNNQVILNGNQFFKEESNSFPVFLSALYKHTEITYPKFHKMDNLCKLGILASELLIQSSQITKAYSLDTIGIVLSNASSSIDTDWQHQLSIADKTNYFPSPAVFVYTLPNIVIGEIAIKHKLSGENAFLISGKFEAHTLVNYADVLLNSGSHAIIVGWLETNGEGYEAFLFIMEKGLTYNASDINTIYQSW